MPLTITSPAFTDGAPIPPRHTCDDVDASPILTWSGAPSGTKSYALICDDPDAPAKTWVHWVLFNIGPDQTRLPEAVPALELLNEIGPARQGVNDFGKVGYGGPCPPPGPRHRYYFKLYALDTRLGLKAGTTKADLERAMQGHVLAQADLIGTYARHAR